MLLIIIYYRLLLLLLFIVTAVVIYFVFLFAWISRSIYTSLNPSKPFFLFFFV